MSTTIVSACRAEQCATAALDFLNTSREKLHQKDRKKFRKTWFGWGRDRTEEELDAIYATSDLKQDNDMLWLGIEKQATELFDLAKASEDGMVVVSHRHVWMLRP